MPSIVTAIYNLKTGELISREIVGESNYDPMPAFVDVLLVRWNKEHSDNETA